MNNNFGRVFKVYSDMAPKGDDGFQDTPQQG